MATWNEMLEEVLAVTVRPDLVTESGIALRKAVRATHASGRFWKDLAVVTASPLAVAQVQSIDLSIHAPRFRQVAYVSSVATPDFYLNPITIDELLDFDGIARSNSYWGLGNTFQVRAAVPETSYTFAYYRYPTVFPTAAFDSWVAENFSDLLVCKAAGFLCGIVGEQEIQRKMEMAAAELQIEFIAANLEIVSR